MCGSLRVGAANSSCSASGGGGGGGSVERGRSVKSVQMWRL